MEGGVCQGLTAFIMRVGLVVFPFRGGWVGGACMQDWDLTAAKVSFKKL